MGESRGPVVQLRGTNKIPHDCKVGTDKLGQEMKDVN